METQTKKRWLWKRAGYSFLVVMLAVAVTLLGLNITIEKNTGELPKLILTVGNPVDAFTGTVDYSGLTSDVVQQALNALPATGGELQLISPTYTFTGTVSRAINNVKVKGINGTTINYNAADAVFSVGAQTGWVFEDIRTDAGGITNSNNALLINVTLGATYYTLRAPNTTGNISAPSITDSGLTVDHLVNVGTGGLLEDGPGYDSTTRVIEAATGRGATYVIAASNSAKKSQADIVLTGTPATDTVTLNDLLSGLTSGAHIHFLEGTFILTQTGSTGYSILLPQLAGMRFTGEGWGDTGASGGTRIQLDTGAECDLFYANYGAGFEAGLHFEHIYFAGDTAGTVGSGLNISNVGIGDLHIDHCRFSGFAEHGANIVGWGTRVTNNVFEDNGASGLTIQAGQSQSYVTGNFFSLNGTYGAHIKNSYVVFSNNQIHENTGIGLYWQSSSNGVITGNILAGPPAAINFGLLYLNAGNNNVISANYVDAKSRISANYAKYAIEISGTENSVTNNMLRNGSTANLQNTGTDTLIEKNHGYIAPGEIRTYSGTITATAADTSAVSLLNPWGQDVGVLRVDVRIGTVATAASTVDVGIGATGADSTGFWTASDVHGGTGYFTSTVAPGTQTVPIAWADTDYFNIYTTATGATTDMVATYTVTVMGN